jgi:hypothetical protein
MAMKFSRLATTTQQSRVRSALAAGVERDAGEVCIWLEQPESELPAIQSTLEAITEEEVTTMTTTTTETAPKAKRSRRAPVEREHEAVTNGGVERADHEAIVTADEAKTKPKHGDPQKAARNPKGGRMGLTTSRVEPVEPKREAFGDGAAGTKAYRAAMAKYEMALEAYRAGEVNEPGGNVPPKVRISNPPVKAKRAAAKAKEAAADAKPKAPARQRVEVAPGFDWNAKGLAAKVVKAKQAGKTIKAISVDLGLPQNESAWHKLSLVYRAEADRQGIARPRRSVAS